MENTRVTAANEIEKYIREAATVSSIFKAPAKAENKKRQVTETRRPMMP